MSCCPSPVQLPVSGLGEAAEGHPSAWPMWKPWKKVLAVAWPSPGCSDNLESESADKRPTSVSDLPYRFVVHDTQCTECKLNASTTELMGQRTETFRSIFLYYVEIELIVI